MLIGELAHRTGLSRDTIRYYEKIGLIRTVRSKGRTNNYKQYSEQVMQDLLLIRQIKQCGFTLREIRDLFDLREYDLVSCDRVGDLVERKRRQIDQKINELTAMRERLVRLQDTCSGDCLAAMAG